MKPKSMIEKSVVDIKMIEDSITEIEQPNIKKSDDHYRDIEGSGDVEPIIIREELIARLIKNGVSSEKAMLICDAQKYISRASVKSGEDWVKEINKAINYLTRAVTGDWVK